MSAALARALRAAAAAPGAARGAATAAGGARHQTCAFARSLPTCTHPPASRADAPRHAVFDLAAALPRFGVGARLTRTSWGSDSFWTVSHVRPQPVRFCACARPPAQRTVAPAAAPSAVPCGAGCARCACALRKSPKTRARRLLSVCCAPQDGRHGKAWGTLTWRGVEGGRQEIRGTLKPLWASVDAPPPLSGPSL
jgi:hypothetical protein